MYSLGALLGLYGLEVGHQEDLISTILKTDVLEQPITYEIDENNLKSDPIDPGLEPSEDNVNVEAETISAKEHPNEEVYEELNYPPKRKLALALNARRIPFTGAQLEDLTRKSRG